MPDRTSAQPTAGDDAPELAATPRPDLNALLAHEQTAIMSAEAATDIGIRDTQREAARTLRALVDQTSFPAREPHDFDRLLPARPGSDAFAAEFERLKLHVEDMEETLAFRFAEGTIGHKHNSFAHRTRVIDQARGRLNDLVKLQADAVAALNNGGGTPT